MSEDTIFVSTWDSSHFGVKIAKAYPSLINHVLEIDEFARKHEVALAITRCNASSIPLVHALMKKSHLLMDTLVRYNYDFTKKGAIKTKIDQNIRPAIPSDVSKVKELTRLSFETYNGHFHSDPRLPNELCTAIYANWAVNSVLDDSLADGVYVYDEGKGPEGFITVKKLNEHTSDGVLACVSPESQGKGIYRKLIEYAMHWSVEQDIKVMELGPLLDNYAVQRVWQRLGFEIYSATYTFHKWIKT